MQLKWRYELGRFEDIRVLTVGLEGGICCPSTSEIIEPEEGDVLVCEYSTVDRALDAFDDDNLLHSIVIDCRHPAAFFATVGNSEERDAQTEWYGRTELETISWWGGITKFLKRVEVRRLVVQFSDEGRDSLVTSAMVDREQLEILSLRFACLIGPKLFVSKSSYLQRRVMLWARQKGKKLIPDKTARVSRVLNEAIHPMVFRMTKSLASISDIEWDFRLCSMPDNQRKAYDNCCSEVRGALAGSLHAYKGADSSFRSFRAILDALFRLRQHCFYSNGVDAGSVGVIRNRLLVNTQCQSPLPTNHEVPGDRLDGVFWRKIKDSSAQPDSSLAMDMMNNSAKLRELASILVFDCSLVSHASEEVIEYLRDFREDDSDSALLASDDPKKVAILAVLPEIQMLISVFLNAIGVRHDLLHRIPTGQTDSDPGDGCSLPGQSDLGPDHWSALAYSEKQNSLSRFGLEATGQSEFGYFASTDVVVSSPEEVGSWMCGLSIESAEYIISVDEDWTCSGDFLLTNILTRCLGRAAAKGDTPELIQIVCDNTLEKKLFEYREESDRKATHQLRCQLDRTCFMRIPDSDALAVGIYGAQTPPAKFASHPGNSLLKLRNSVLSDVLSTTEELAPRFLSGQRVRFLPRIRDEGNENMKSDADPETLSEIAFLREFVRYERMASIRNPASHPKAESGLHVVSDEGSAREHKNTGCSQSVVHFPSYLMTRQDLFSLSTLFYFERQSSASVWKPIVTGSIPISLAQLPGPVGKADVLSTHVGVASAASDLAETWRKSGLGCKPDDMAASLLFYGAPSKNKSGKAPENTPSVEKTLGKGRFNAYAKLYTTHWDGGLIRDGNQGTESLVFFPPLFPRTYECARKTEGRLRTIMTSQQHEHQSQPDPNSPPHHLGQAGASSSIQNSGDKKRKSLPVSDDHFSPTTKKMRSEGPAPVPQHTSVSHPPPPAIDDDLLDNLEGILDDDDEDVAPFATFDPPTGPLVPGSDPLIPDSGPHMESADLSSLVPDMEPEIPVVKEEEMSVGGMEVAILGFDEDFGLLGAGVLPTIDNCSSDAHYAHIRNREIPDPLSNVSPCDSEEVYGVRGEWVASTLNSVILFVKRPPPLPFNAQMKGQPLAMPPAVGSWPGNMHQHPMGVPSHDSSFKDINGYDAPKKKKKSSSQSGVSALARPPPIEMNPIHGMKSGPPPNMMHFAPGKDTQQHRLHASYASRHYATGFSMFESASFQVAALKVKNRIASDLAVRQQKSGAKSGETDRARSAQDVDPSHASLFVRRLQSNSQTGDAAKALASSQRSSLRRSLVAPCRVDFGPFSGGFLALASGMTGISPPRSRLGVSLPMGVKVTQVREQPHLVWTSADDQLLQHSATRFGMNWMVVARALNGLDFGGRSLEKPDAGFDSTIVRSARQCRDRWQALARSRPSLANDIRKSERVLRENALTKPDLSPGADDAPLRAFAPVEQGVEFRAIEMLYSTPRTDYERPIQDATCFDEPALMDIDPTASSSTPEGSHPIATSAPDATKTSQEQAASAANTQPASTTKTKRRSFSAFAAAKAKKQFIPLAVPGVPSGGQPNQPVPSHASHTQSVEASVAAQWSSGRTEMWPLQILDCAEKYRAAAAARPTPPRQPQQPPQRNITGTPGSSKTMRASSSSSSPSRRPASSSSAQRSRSQQSSSSSQFPAVPSNIVRASGGSNTVQRASSSSSSTQRTTVKPPVPSAAKKSGESKGKAKRKK